MLVERSYVRGTVSISGKPKRHGSCIRTVGTVVEARTEARHRTLTSIDNVALLSCVLTLSCRALYGRCIRLDTRFHNAVRLNSLCLNQV